VLFRSHPDYLIGRSPEKALINPDNLLILLQHLKSAAFELPIRMNEAFGRLPVDELNGLLEFLEQDGLLHFSGNRYYWVADKYPANEISLRSASGVTFHLQALSDDRWTTVGEVDQESALWMVHPNAIYLHESNTYRVEELDLENKVVKMLPIEVDYFTIPHRHIDVDRISTLQEKKVSGAHAYYGDILVTELVTGYRKIQWTTRENIGDYPLDLPSTQLRTVAYWLTIDQVPLKGSKKKGFGRTKVMIMALTGLYRKSWRVCVTISLARYAAQSNRIKRIMFITKTHSRRFHLMNKPTNWII
jgi:DEAD/DEAH box helicase domain-containing protein